MKFKNMPIFVSDVLGHFGSQTDIFCRILLDYFCLNMVQKQPAPYIYGECRLLFAYNPFISPTRFVILMTDTPKTLLLVDGSSYLYRAFYAMTHLTAPDGTPTNAVYGVLNMLRRLRAEQPHDFCACVFDAKGKNFRHELFEDYKATRPPMPDDLRPQADMLPELVELMGWKVLKVAQVEADDVIGTLAVQAAAQKMNVVISTGDKDMAQLVGEHITLVNTMKNETLDSEGVYQKGGQRAGRGKMRRKNGGQMAGGIRLARQHHAAGRQL